MPGLRSICLLARLLLLCVLAAAQLEAQPGLPIITRSGNQVTVDTPNLTLVLDGLRMISLHNKLAPSGPNYLAVDHHDPFLIENRTSPQEALQPADRAQVTGITVVNASFAIIELQATQGSANYLYQLWLAVEPIPPYDVLLQVWVSNQSSTQALELHRSNLHIYVERTGGRMFIPNLGGLVMQNAPWPSSASERLFDHLWFNTKDTIGLPVLIYEQGDRAGGFFVHPDSQVEYVSKKMDIQIEDGSSGQTGPAGPTSAPWRRLTLSSIATGGERTNWPGHVLRLNTFAGNWSFAVGQLKTRPFFQAPAVDLAWVPTLRLAIQLQDLRFRRFPSGPCGPFVGNIAVPDIHDKISEINALFPNARPLLPGNVLILANGWNTEGHSLDMPYYTLRIPIWESLPMDPSPTGITWTEAFIPQVRALGYHVLPYFNAGATHHSMYYTTADPVTECIDILESPSSLWPLVRPDVIQVWDPGSGTILPDLDFLETVSYQYAHVSPTSSQFRQVLIPRIKEVHTLLGTDGIYLDQLHNSWDAGDLHNPSEDGVKWAETFSMVQELIHNTQGAPTPIMGEFPVWGSILAGQRLSQSYSPGTVGFWNKEHAYKSAGQHVANFLNDICTPIRHLSVFSIDGDPITWFRSYMADYVHGCVPTTFWPNPHHALLMDDQFRFRGKKLLIERALYHHNKMGATQRSFLWLEPHQAWSQPDTYLIENHDGTAKVRTELWLTKVLFTDAYYLFKRYPPNAVTLNQFAGTPGIRNGALIAALQGPLPDRPLRPWSRARALWDIYQNFPDYPFPSLQVVDSLDNNQLHHIDGARWW